MILVTLALIAMCGLLGLAVDLGWSYFTKKSAQNAADGAALAVAYQVLANKGQITSFSGSDVLTGGNCDLSGAMQFGCDYAEQDDFNPGGHSGHQNVNIQDGLGAATRLDGTTVPALWWVTVRTVETIPQLFSAVLGNTTGIASARATAVIANVRVSGSLITLNRVNDQIADKSLPKGQNIKMGGGDTITAPEGVTISSTSGSAGAQNGVASINDSPISVMSPGGTIDPKMVGPGSTLTPSEDGPKYQDPFEGDGQPPLTGATLPTYAVVGNNLTNLSSIFPLQGSTNVYMNTLPNSLTGQGYAYLPPGNYVPVQQGNCNGSTCQANLGSGQLTLSGTTTFGTSSTFSNFFFYGGLNVGRNTMVMSPGEYVMVGGGAGKNPADINTDNKGFMDASGTAGEMIVLTGSSGAFTQSGSTVTGPSDLYPGLLAQINSNQVMVSMAANGDLAFGPATLLSGADSPTAAVTGIGQSTDPSSPGYNTLVPANLSPFAGVVVWQDQANSNISYTNANTPNVPSGIKGTGYVDIWSCGSGHNINSPCPDALQNTSSPSMTFQANASGGFHGIVYQPRGAWISTLGGPGTGIQGAVQIITGAIEMQGHGTISTTPPPIPLTRRTVALVE